jgi:predicted nicotinamide N-methyase
VTTETEMHKLERSLERRFRVVETTLSIAGRELSILHPASAEELISEADFEKDERLPYWAELWPSARVLADHVATMRGDGRTLLELGCGSGLVTTAAAIAGFRVTASDYYEDATKFARLNAWRNSEADVRGIMLDWRALPADAGRYDVVLASDVLYERPYGPLVAEVVQAVLAPQGFAIVADPGRVGREAFVAALEPNGLRLRSVRDVAYEDGPIRQAIALLEVGRR